MEIINFDVSKTLEELEGKSHSRFSHVSRDQKVRQTPLKAFTLHEIRLVVEQNSSLKYLVPLAMRHLMSNPLAKGDVYEGDLLNAVLTVEKKFWMEDLRGYIPVLQGIADKALETAKAKPDVYAKFLQNCDGAVKIFKTNVGLI